MSLHETKTAGIKTIVITGDYSTTSEFVLAELGMRVNHSEIMLGEELEKITLEELANKIIDFYNNTEIDKRTISEIIEQSQDTAE